MKQIFTLLLIVFHSATGNTQAGPFLCPADTLSNAVWEYLGGPPAKVTAYAQSKNRVFAGTEKGLFFSDNQGTNWVLHPQTRGKKIENLYANDSVVLFQYLNTYSIGPVSIPSVRFLEVFSSINNGGSFFPAYILDGDAVPFFSSFTPYVWTAFKDLGGGVLYFDHGLPYTGMGTSNPYDNTRYVSTDFGRTWQTHHLTTTSYFFPVSPVVQQLSFCENVLLGTQSVLDTATGFTGLLLVLNGSVSDTLVGYYGSLRNFVFAGGDLYAFNISSYSIPTFRKFAHVLQDDLPLSETIDTLHFPDETSHPSAFWSKDTLLWFKFLNGNLYRSSIYHPHDVSFQYKDLSNVSIAFAAMPAGQFRCDNRQRTLRSMDNGDTWTPAYTHLTTIAYPAFDDCNQPVATYEKNNYLSPVALHYRLESDDQWQYLDSSAEKSLRVPVGKAFGAYYMHQGQYGKIYKSPECLDDPVWELSSLNLNSNDVVLQNGDKAYSYLHNCYGCVVRVSTDGDIWEPGGFYTHGDLYFAGDTLLFLDKTSLRFSTDQGTTWQTRTFPADFDFSWIGFENHNLKAIDNKPAALQWVICQDFMNSDLASSWQGKCPLSHNDHAYTQFGDATIKINLADHASGIFFLHAQDGLYISNDDAGTWHRFSGLPFRNYFQQPAYQTGVVQYGSAEGGNGYRIYDGYLYAFTDNEGIWRTDWAPILAQLPETGIVETETLAEAGIFLFPNPAKDVIYINMPEHVAGGMIRVTDGLLREVQAKKFQGNSMQLEVAQWPSGIYFLVVQADNGAVFCGKWSKL